jgi:hypothetical protein
LLPRPNHFVLAPELVAARLEPKAPVPASAQVAAHAQAMTTTNDPRTLVSLARDLLAAVARLESNDAARSWAQAADALTQAMARTNEPLVVAFLAEALSEILGGDWRLARVHSVVLAVGSLHQNYGLLGALVLLNPTAGPIQRRLSDRELVELLKRPLCIGAARRVVLDQLQHHHQRPFADQWDFVRFADEKKLGLDFTTPPRRP